MRYFTYITEQSFKSDNEGRRLFYIGSPFSRPYMIPDAATEARLFRKMTWHHRIFLSALILGQPFLFCYFIRHLWLIFEFLASVIILQWVTLRIVFYSDLHTLHRATSRLSLRIFYTGMAQRHSEVGLVLGFLGCIAFVIVGTFISFTAGGWILVFGMPAAVFFNIYAVAWGYALHLKRCTTTPLKGPQ